MATYTAYFRYGGWAKVVVVLVLFAFGQGLVLGADWWLMLWATKPQAEQTKEDTEGG